MASTEKEFDEVKLMTKSEAVKEVKSFFKGNDIFVEKVVFLIYATHNFEKIKSMKISEDDSYWEKNLSIIIYSKIGFKTLYYRKVNKEYSKILNGTADIEGFELIIYDKEKGESEEFDF